MTLDAGKATLASQFDARAPLLYGKFTITIPRATAHAVSA